MLIILRSINEVTKNDEPIRKKMAFDKIIRSHESQNHFVIIEDEPESYDIDDFQDFGMFIQQVLYQIKDKYTENCALLNLVNRKLIVDFSKPKMHESLIENQVFELGYEKIMQSRFVDQPVFIAEDDNDRIVFDLFCKYFLFKRNASNINISLNFQDGIGNRCRDVFDRVTSQGNMVLCIVDSDKRHPKDKMSQTALRLKGVAPSISSACYEINIVRVHEAENIIPIDFYIKYYEEMNDVQTKSRVEKLKKVLSKNKEALFYYDFKNGFSAYRLAEFKSKYDSFWDDILEIEPKCRNCISSFDSFEKDKDTQKIRCLNSDNCRVSSPICKNAVSVIEKLKTNNDLCMLVDSYSSETTPIILELGQLITSWGLASNFEPAS